jgi:hypothetical protein
MTSPWTPARATCAAALTLLALTAAPAGAAVTITAGGNTVATPRFAADFDDTNVEQLHALTWAGLPSTPLVAEGGPSGCGDAVEAWGQSYADPAPFGVMVAAGSRGIWQDAGEGTVQIDSQVTATGCDGYEGNLPVRTTYGFFDAGSGQGDEIAVTRTLGFGPTPTDFTQKHLRPYVPRLPAATFTQVLSPDAGTLKTTDASFCGSVCTITAWDGTWFAQHDPTDGGRGLLVLRDPATVAANPARLLVDNDGSSASNDSSADLLPPLGGWSAPVTETEYLCFYDATTWPAAQRAALKPPTWCGPAPEPTLTIAGAVVSEGAGSAALTVTRSDAGVPAPRFDVVATDGTAKLGSDYGTPVAAAFATGATTATVTVPILDDAVHEATEKLTVALSDVVGATVTGGPATVTIADDDAAPTTTTTTTSTTTTVPPAPTPITPEAPAPPAPAPATPPVTATSVPTPPKAADVITLPSTRACVSRRSFRIRLRQPKGIKIAKATVRLDGKLVKTLTGARVTAPVDLRGLPKGRFTVTIAVTTSTGTVLRDRRTYRTCAVKKKA